MFGIWTWISVFLIATLLSGIWGAWIKLKPYYETKVYLSPRNGEPEPNYNSRQFVGVSIENKSGDALRNSKLKVMEIYDIGNGKTLLSGSHYFQWSGKSTPTMYRDKDGNLVEGRQKREADIYVDEPFFADCLYVSPLEKARLYVPIWGDDVILDDPGGEILVRAKLFFDYKGNADSRDYWGKTRYKSTPPYLQMTQLTQGQYNSEKQRPSLTLAKQIRGNPDVTENHTT